MREEIKLPAYKSHNVVEIARGLKAFLKFDVGLVHGTVPDFEQMFRQAQNQLKQKDRQLKQMRNRLTGAGVQAENETEPLTYQALYEARIRETSPDVAIGTARPFDLVGRLEIAALKYDGLKPTDTLVDLGCGSGRLAVHAIPYLAGGHYIGVDIAPAMLDEAQKRVEENMPDPPSHVSWVRQRTPSFELDANGVDMFCAFAVINHMEHEDSYLYLERSSPNRPSRRTFRLFMPPYTHGARTIDILQVGENGPANSLQQDPACRHLEGLYGVHRQTGRVDCGSLVRRRREKHPVGQRETA